MPKRIYQSGSDLSVRQVLLGAAAGLVATASMSLTMLLGWRLLPGQERYPLPPRLITEEISERVGLRDHLSDDQLVGLTVSSHFGYGALFGAVYALYEDRIPMHSSLRGTLAGLAIWVVSYLGWLPAFGVLRPATRHPWRRNLLMLIAHVVWGVTLGELVRRLTERG